MSTTTTPVCQGCNRTPDQIMEFKIAARQAACTPTEYVLAEEGTLNPENLHFLCTDCYIKAGQPSAPWPGWKCP